MSEIRPLVVDHSGLADLRPTAAPRGCRATLWERSRLEWRVGEPGDPTRLLEAFLAEHGIPLTDLSRTRSVTGCRGDGVCGATVLLGGGAAQPAPMPPMPPMPPMAPGPARPGPVPAVPDLVAVVYEHRPGRPPGPTRPAGDLRLGGWRPSWPPARHAAAVEAVRAAIARGDVYQVNLVGHASAPYTGDPAAALRRVAALAGARYGTVVAGHGWAVASASPETLVSVRHGRGGAVATTKPIKGTRPATPRGRGQLLASAKERAEHVMIVDLMRNDLARVAATGSVVVDSLYDIRRWCDLWQAESTVTARLAGGVGLADLLDALWPGGSVTGAPKRAARSVIDELEPVGRGPSMGAIGWVSASGPDALDLGLTIRTVAVDTDRVHVWAGGGITWDSDPAAEVAEAAAKAAPIRAALAAPG